MVEIEDVKSFWHANPCNSRWSSNLEDRKRYFKEIETTRYEIEWHIPIVARFEQFCNKDVLEIGCGMGTDGSQFAKNGARYVGIDLTPAAVRLARERFSLFDHIGKFEVISAEKLPFPNQSFDHVYSFGVIHHTPNTEMIIKEMYRVLRPGGTFCVMVYNKSSINYYIEIMFVRKIFRLLLYPGWSPRLISKLTGFEEWKLKKHREIVLRSEKMTKDEWISINTDGPECPLAKVFNKAEVLNLFKVFSNVKTEVWHFRKSHWAFLGRLIPRKPEAFLGRNWGWHRIVYGEK